MPLEMKETNISIKHKIPTGGWQLAINEHDRRVELRSTEKQLQLSGQGGTWTPDLCISSPVP